MHVEQGFSFLAFNSNHTMPFIDYSYLTLPYSPPHWAARSLYIISSTWT